MANALTAALAEPRVTGNGPETLAGMVEAWDPSHWRETPSTRIFQKSAALAVIEMLKRRVEQCYDENPAPDGSPLLLSRCNLASMLHDQRGWRAGDAATARVPVAGNPATGGEPSHWRGTQPLAGKPATSDATAAEYPRHPLATRLGGTVFCRMSSAPYTKIKVFRFIGGYSVAAF